MHFLVLCVFNDLFFFLLHLSFILHFSIYNLCKPWIVIVVNVVNVVVNAIFIFFF